jgi:hypothetical protein
MRQTPGAKLYANVQLLLMPTKPKAIGQRLGFVYERISGTGRRKPTINSNSKV